MKVISNLCESCQLNLTVVTKLLKGPAHLLSTVIIVMALLSLSATAASVGKPKCEVCTGIVDKFKEVSYFLCILW